MVIEYNQYAKTFELTLDVDEFQAIREFMKLASVVSLHSKPFSNENCNTIDACIAKKGRELSDKIRDFFVTGNNNGDNDDEDDDETITPTPKRPTIK